MKVSIFGLGYVGVVSAACFSRDGFAVTGVDIQQDKVDRINNGQSPIVETGLSKLLKKGVTEGKIRATTDVNEAVRDSTVSVISVGTPSRADGALDLQYVYRVCEQIGTAVAQKEEDHVVVIRSTVFPGTTEKCKEILESKAGGQNVYVAFNPEFLREGSAIKDFDDAPYTIIGAVDQEAEIATSKLYSTVDAPVYSIAPGEAELIKYASNAWHATKISFANEIGRIAKSVSVDARKVMDILVSDKKLNISTAYMKPGFAYGGSCLPKDVRALEYFGKLNNVSLPLLSSLSLSNEAQIDFALHQILKKTTKKVGLLGLAFKPGTDDLRESPAVVLAERLLGKGYSLSILDSAVHESKIVGSNKEYIEKKIPHLSKLLVATPAELLDHSELIIVTHGAAEFRKMLESNGDNHQLLDLTGIFKDNGIHTTYYEGIAW